MAPPGDLKRFNDAICEAEGIVLQCKTCGLGLVKKFIPYEGITITHITMTLLYCNACEIYYTNWDENDEHE